ncbi:MAG: enoyl-CoA hydratase/isomerase family protein, partial [Chloroflexaceae bacterium]|nr:enoyl-CoA hydratase/isomerase family protein [Chloroflexaceae bacterium]
MSDEQLVLSATDGHVATLTLNRPKALNALSPELIDALIAALEQCEADAQIRVVVLTGGPRAFAAVSYTHLRA